METTILENAADAAKTRHVAGVCFRCSDCKQVLPVQTEGGTGYARMHDSDSLVCYSCADKRQTAELKDRSKPFVAYISSDGLRITTWTCGMLMRITKTRSCPLTRSSYTHNRNSYMSVHAVDVHGGHWTGRGSAGVAIKMRPVG